ncbi:polysaccharide deacetylase family protein [Pseudomonas gingeri]|uniref:Polysaccharide deacetylase family protein n=1 Tax=Pseudomonas gingeri TaxID=117681 RepID=A0A7Y7YFZ4_9PSED|nr:polysaccharide deacetylase family protein [Pseudomonas gingeri]NWA00294.1 polysaccharide deacetylase family protein [Pseudomonas gingeri]NWA12032.1 polysaccharide deacetylase family protein [Pseudomonas gingeri]NWA58631.1 polysaccharide deacetylase family protein [Pseudomonas gingeri]NWA98154.1 polysaccharide deacetylase family protein [Pseudomonas gingeri]NWB00474.1 polysaccharide deacetylase family protein [Pseudomonas gingeri]
MRIVLFFSTLLACLAAVAAPNDAATVDRGTWPEQLSSPALFDVASRAEILTFAHALLVSEMTDEAALKQRLGLKQINLASINRVRARLWQRLLENYNFAQQSCEQDASFCYYIEDMDSLREQAGKFRVAEDSFYARWAEPSRAFHERYLDELLRLAALFPQTSSEIALFGEPERNGEAFHDRLFLLSFDGGPGVSAGNTDELAEYLRRQKMNGLFFVLGSALQARVDRTSIMAVRDLYKEQCVGIQGWQYRSHSHWQDWQDSVQRSAMLAQRVLPQSYQPLFRPPYGQRQADSGAFFKSEGLQVVLWDIDSADATGKLTAEQSAQRVLTLMLLWRRGVIVFHDTQDKALGALPWLLRQTAQSGLGWKDCSEAFR